MSVYLRLVILLTLFASIPLFAQWYSSLYSYTHKQANLKRSLTISQS